MSGYVRVQRDRFGHHMFAREKFCRGYAWDWMVAQARFADGFVSIAGKSVPLRRGQFSHSIRFMADAWNWDKAAVSRFIARLKTETMIETDTETGQLVVTICNYDKYQADPRQTETAAELEPRQQRDSSETKNKKDLREEGKEGKGRLRGKRLPADWKLPREWGVWALEQGMPEARVRAEADKFRDYWTAKTKDATKLDWLATWRNWIRTATQKVAPASSDQKLAAWGIGDAQPVRLEPRPWDPEPEGAAGAPDVPRMQSHAERGAPEDSMSFGDAIGGWDRGSLPSLRLVCGGAL